MSAKNHEKNAYIYKYPILKEFLIRKKGDIFIRVVLTFFLFLIPILPLILPFPEILRQFLFISFLIMVLFLIIIFLYATIESYTTYKRNTKFYYFTEKILEIRNFIILRINREIIANNENLKYDEKKSQLSIKSDIIEQVHFYYEELVWSAEIELQKSEKKLKLYFKDVLSISFFLKALEKFRNKIMEVQK